MAWFYAKTLQPASTVFALCCFDIHFYGDSIRISVGFMPRLCNCLVLDLQSVYFNYISVGFSPDCSVLILIAYYVTVE